MPTKKKPFHDLLLNDYLTYTLSVILSRALPDERDGLKPVQRRILYAMYKAGFRSEGHFKKSARVVGETLGKFHPHSDGSVYGALVQQAQDFSRNIPLVTGQGNFGSRGSDGPAAMRYTECKLSKFAEEVVLADLKRPCVDFMPNFDASLKEPVVLPTKVPLALLNGSSGIAVGYANSCPPHSLSEICEALLLLLEKDATEEEIAEVLKGPDFPTRAQIDLSRQDWIEILSTGRGSVKVYAKYRLEEGKKKRLVFYELPYQSNIDKIVERIAALKKKFPEILQVYDETGLEGVALSVELSKKADVSRVAAILYKYTDLQTSVQYNMVVVRGNKPVSVSLKESLESFIEFRLETLNRFFKLEREEVQRNLLFKEALSKAVDALDEVVEIVRTNSDLKVMTKAIMKLLGIGEEEALFVLNTRLQKLSKLEADKLKKEIKKLKKRLRFLEATIDNREALKNEMALELEEIQQKYGEERKTTFLKEKLEEVRLDKKSLVAQELSIGISEDLKVTITSKPGSFWKSFTGYENESMLFLTKSFQVGRLKLRDLKSFKAAKYDLREVVADLKEEASDVCEKDVAAFLAWNSRGYGRLISAKSCQRGPVVAPLVQDKVDGVLQLKESSPSLLCFVTSDLRILVYPLEKLKPVSRGAKSFPLVKVPEGETLVAVFLASEEDSFRLVFENQEVELRVGDFPKKGRGGRGAVMCRPKRPWGRLVKLVADQEYFFQEREDFVKVENGKIVKASEGTKVSSEVFYQTSDGRLGRVLFSKLDQAENVEKVFDSETKYLLVSSEDAQGRLVFLGPSFPSSKKPPEKPLGIDAKFIIPLTKTDYETKTAVFVAENGYVLAVKLTALTPSGLKSKPLALMKTDKLKDIVFEGEIDGVPVREIPLSGRGGKGKKITALQSSQTHSLQSTES